MPPFLTDKRQSKSLIRSIEKGNKSFTSPYVPENCILSHFTLSGKLQKRKWENAMTIDRLSWGFRRDANLNDYFSIEELIKQLASTVR